MKRSAAIILTVILGVTCFAAGEDAGWLVRGAPWRVALRAVAPPDAPQAGWEIRLPDFGEGRADMRDAVLIGPDGKEIALDGVWRDPGGTLLLLAGAMPEQGSATLYFGGNASRRMKSWSAKRSLLLETRRLPAGADIRSFAGWQAAWRKSRAVDGMAFVPQIFHGGNPFGDGSRFMSRYTGRLRAGDGGAISFYTLSDDVCYVTVDGRPLLKWHENHPPPRDPAKAPQAAVRVPKGLVAVDYCHAVTDAPAAMALGWDRGGKQTTIPAEAWIHPGRVEAGAVESNGQTPVPLANLSAERYLGYGGEWYVSLKANLPDLPEGWRARWQWPDNRGDEGAEIRRLWMSLEPVTLRVRLGNGHQSVEGRRTLRIPQDMEAASVNNPGQLQPFLDLLRQEDPLALPETGRRAGFILANDFLPAAEALPWADAWLALAKPAPGPWVEAIKASIRGLARTDPQAALRKLTNLPPPATAALGNQAQLLELDLRVFDLADPMVVGLAGKLAKSGDAALARMATIRLGDYHLLQERTEEAVRCYHEAVGGSADKNARAAPVLDRARSIEIENLLQRNDVDEAARLLLQWERERPMARIEADQLLWRGRVRFAADDHRRALQDLETSLRIRPGSPEEIEVLFWQGRALYELSRKDQAREVWKALMKDYPKHERAEAARQWSEKP